MHSAHPDQLLQVLQVAALVTLSAAAAVLRLHHVIRARERAAAEAGQRLALEFARFLTGACDADAVRRAANAVRPEVFWAALEAFTDNIRGEEWRRLSRELRPVPAVRRERSRLRSRSAWVRALAARHLGFVHAEGVRAPLREVMARGPELVTLTAALALARLHDHEALTWLLAHPAATRDRARHQLVALLKRFSPEALVLLRQAVASEAPREPIHLATIEVLGLWRDRRALPVLRRLLAAAPAEGRIASARALGRIGSPRSAVALIAALRDPVWQVRAQAALALGELGAPAAIAALVAAVRDPSWWVRRHSAYALARLGPAGVAALRRVAAGDRDRYACEIAQEALQVLAWDEESPGAVSRVG
jgi:hypothetical protein